jgi:hypothetical protein
MGTRTFSTLKKKLFVCIFPLLLITGFLLPVRKKSENLSTCSTQGLLPETISRRLRLGATRLDNFPTRSQPLKFAVNQPAERHRRPR